MSNIIEAAMRLKEVRQKTAGMNDVYRRAFLMGFYETEFLDDALDALADDEAKLADAYLALTAAGPLFRVRALEWEDYGRLSRCDSPCGKLEVWEQSVGIYVWAVDHHESEDPVEPCDSLEDGKAKAEAWYRDRLAAALEPVT